jgi:TolB protein
LVTDDSYESDSRLGMIRFVSFLSIVIGFVLSLVHSSIYAQSQSLAVSNGLIAFASNISGQFEIYTVNQLGSNVAQLTDQGGDHPNWSPDGTRIAFVSRRDGDLDIYVMNADGSNQRKLIGLSDRWDFSPVWSPDGSQIAFASQSMHGVMHGDIYIVNADGSNLRNITVQLTDHLNFSPSWSPDGSEIFFLSDANHEPQGGAFRSSYDLFAVGADGNNLRMVSGGGYVSSAEMSPNGDKFILEEFQIGLNLGSEIVAILQDQNVAYLLSAFEGEDVDPSWSPDGNLIVFSRFENGHYVLYTMLTDGSHQTRVTNAELGDERHSDWQPISVSEALE